MVKNSQAQATNAHISIAANIPPEELRRGLLAEDIDNGFANRFIWCCSRGSKLLPEGGKIDLNLEFEQTRREFMKINIDELQGEVKLNGDAQDIWGYNNNPQAGVYSKLAAPKSGMFGQVTARAAQQVLRLALIYSLLDGVLEIRREHLQAALEVWRYCEESCRYIFGDTTGNATADTILRALAAKPHGMTRLEINRLFQGNKSAEEIEHAQNRTRKRIPIGCCCFF